MTTLLKMKLNFKPNINIQQPTSQQPSQPSQPSIRAYQNNTFVLGATKNRNCAALYIQGNKTCSSCGGKR